MLVIKRIHVLYRLRAPEAARETVERVMKVHPPRCPVYRTLSGCIDITVELQLEPDRGDDGDPA